MAGNNATNAVVQIAVLQIAQKIWSDGVQKQYIFFLLDVTVGSSNFKSLQGFLHLLLCLCVKERKKKQLHLLQDTSLPHLVLFFLALPILALLVGKGVTTQASSSSKKTPKTQS
jgi:hypothetical protein